MNVTARRVQGPGFEIVGLDGPQGAHTALWLPEGSPCRADGLTHDERARAFLERPHIAGLARLVGVAQEGQTAWYSGGEVWSAVEILASMRRRQAVPGLKAAVELAWRVSEVLEAAERDGAGFGLRGHGAVDPWRLAVRKDGQTIVFGYGLSTGRPLVRCQGAEHAEAVRYSPPERLAGHAEDGTSDLFSLSLVALEWALGTPVYEGEGEELRRSALDAGGDRRLWAWRDRLPADVVEFFGRSLRRDADARWPSVAVYRDEVRRLLSHPAVVGPSLMQLMSSGDIDPANRFVGLAELRGGGRTALGIGATSENVVGQRWVSLGGRAATAMRQAAEERELALAASATVVAPPRAPAAPPAFVTPMVAAVPDDAGNREAEARVAVAVEERVQAPPPIADEPIAVLAPPIRPAKMVVEVTPDPDEMDTLFMPRSVLAASLADAAPQELKPAARRDGAWSVEDQPTKLEAVTGDLARFKVTDSDERVTVHIVPMGMKAAEVMEVVARDRGLPRTDLLGATVFAWRLARDGVVVSDNAPAKEFVGGPTLTLVRVNNRPVLCHLVARDEQGELWLTSAVGTAVPVSRIIPWAVQVLGLEPGPWTLSCGGEIMLPDSVLEGWLEEGGLLELAR